MRGVYTAEGTISGLTSARTLLYITAVATGVVKVLSAHIGNATNETNEQMDICWKKVGTLGTPTATTLTPSKHEIGDQAAAATVKLNVTASEPTYTASTFLGHRGVASLNGYDYPHKDSEAFYIRPGETWGLVLISAITSMDAVVNVTFQEIG